MNKYPLTPQQVPLYNEITKDIVETIERIKSKEGIKDGSFYFIQGKAGVGKTEFAKKLFHFCWKNYGIAVGCSATALAATIYESANFETTHSLFKIPVDLDDDNEDEKDIQCGLNEDDGNKERIELLNNTSLIIWDECCSNNVKIFDSVYKSSYGFKNTVVVCLGSYEQILPILRGHPSKFEIFNSCLCKSHYWKKFNISVLKNNLRVVRTDEVIDGINVSEHFEYFIDAISQNSILPVSSNYFGESNINYDKPLLDQNGYYIPTDILEDTNYYKFKNLKIFTTEQKISDEEFLINNQSSTIDKNLKDSINFLYPNGFMNSDKIDNYVVAAVNDRIYYWNEEIQKLNTNKLHIIIASNKFAEVDDPFHNLMDLFSVEKINENLINHNVPLHKLLLKVGDICLLCVNYSKRFGLTKNRKVIIVEITAKKIAVIIANDSSNIGIVWIPRLKFLFRTKNGSSFSIIRTQFPFRLAYCLTYNKSQGQSSKGVIMDVTYPPFAHGHLYVALTRCRFYKRIAFYGLESQVHRDEHNEIDYINIQSIMHKEVLQEFNQLT